MNILKTTLVGAAALLLVGCSASPKDAVIGMYDALADGDVAALQENVTDNTGGLLVMASMMKCNANKADYDTEEELASVCMEQTFGKLDVKNVEIKSQTENSAVAMVTLAENGKEKQEKLNLVKVDDAWKVNITK